MTELPVINGVQVMPGTALAAVVAISPVELLPLMPVQILTAFNTVPATALAAVIPGVVVPGAVVPTVAHDVYQKALLAISAAATAALASGIIK